MNRVQLSPQYKNRLNGNTHVNGYNTGCHIPVYAKQSKTPPQQKYQQTFQSFAARQNQKQRTTIFKQTKTNSKRLQTLKVQTQTDIQKVIVAARPISTLKQRQQQQQCVIPKAQSKKLLLPPTTTALINSTQQPAVICQKKQPALAVSVLQTQQPRTFLPEQIMPTLTSSIVSNHSIITSTATSSPIYVQQQQVQTQHQQQQQRQTPIVLTGPKQQSPVAVIRSSPPKLQSQSFVDNSQLDIELALTATKVQINRKDDIDSMINSSSSNSNDGSKIVSIGGVKSNKTKNNSKTFVRPTSKGVVENKLATTATKCSSTFSSSSSSLSSTSSTSSLSINRKNTGKSQTTARLTKRSYSQSSHHEALQRISSVSRMSNSCSSTSIYSSRFIMAAPIPKANEWHAPEAYIFDYAGPTNTGTQMVRADHIDLLPCTQNAWYQIRPKIIAAQPITRDQRLDMKKNQLRRQAYQYADAQNFRSTTVARRRLVAVARAMKKLQADSGDAGSSNSSSAT